MVFMQDTTARWKSLLPFDPTYAALTLTALLWSTNFIIGRAVRDDVSPAALNFRGRRLLLAYSVEKLADVALGHVFGGPPTITRWAIGDPGPF